MKGLTVPLIEKNPAYTVESLGHTESIPLRLVVRSGSAKLLDLRRLGIYHPHESLPYAHPVASHWGKEIAKQIPAASATHLLRG